MDRIILERFETSDQGTFGKIRIHDKIFYTLELPWRDNANDISCIPAGVYHCSFTMSARFKKKMYLIENVNNRSGIRIHSSNVAGDKTLGYKCQLNGCIALGEKIGYLEILKDGLREKQKSILISKPAVSKFEILMRGQPFILEVVNGVR
jgi:hypothetical protein